MNSIKWARAFIQKHKVLVGVVVGFFFVTIAFAFYMLAKENSQFNFWYSLGTPPSKAIAIVKIQPSFSTSTLCIDVESITGEYYRYCDHTGWAELSEAELQEESIFQSEECEKILEQRETTILQRAPGKILNCALFQWSWEWITQIEYIAVMEDGSVWGYEYRSDVWPLYVLFISLKCLAMLPFIVGAVVFVGIIWIIIRSMKKKRNHKITQEWFSDDKNQEE